MAIKKEVGKSREFGTGAKRQCSKGKGTPVLIPGDGYIELAKHFEEGAELHGSRNWEKGLPLQSVVNSLERHIAAFKMGMEDEHHLRAVAWNALILLTLKLRIDNGMLPKELDDMPRYKKIEPKIGGYILALYKKEKGH